MSLPILPVAILLSNVQSAPERVAPPIALPLPARGAIGQDNPAPLPAAQPAPPAQLAEPAPQANPAPPVEPPPLPSQTSAAASQSAGQPDIVVTARPNNPADPLAKINQTTFAATQAVDKAVIGPVSLTFAKIVPAPARDGLGNFLWNLHEIDVFLNFVLQHKIGKAAETVGRFVINSTLGVGGLFDIAKRKPFHLPRRRNGFADTMGFYGVKPGPYLFLPVYGATTVRDLIGRSLDRLVTPLALGKPFNRPAFTISTTVATMLDARAEFDDQLQKFRAANDPYAARRDFYLHRRQAEIDHLRGKDEPVANATGTTTPAKAGDSGIP